MGFKAFIKDLFPYSGKKVEKIAIKKLKALNLPEIDRHYKKSRISLINFATKKNATVEYKYTAPTTYHGVMSVSAKYKLYRKANCLYRGKPVKGPWQYELKSAVTFYGIDISSHYFAETRAEILKQYPRLKFNFMSSGIEVYDYSYYANNKANVISAIDYFAGRYRPERTELLKIM
ncbi:MAG: hypothetical protein IJA97_04265, partial [Clostridia bacterium]|nr:hypothetical protein [Clostridia bacterium]